MTLERAKKSAGIGFAVVLAWLACAACGSSGSDDGGGSGGTGGGTGGTGGAASGGTGGSASSCQSSATCEACLTCAQALPDCKALFDACGAGTECATFGMCAGDANDDPVKIEACRTAHPTGADPFCAAQRCVVYTHCDVLCEDSVVCPRQ